jgi:hypothetical protein
MSAHFFLLIKARAAGTQTKAFPNQAAAEAYALKEMRDRDLNVLSCNIWRKSSDGDDEFVVGFRRENRKLVTDRPEARLRLDAVSTRRGRLSSLAAPRTVCV